VNRQKTAVLLIGAFVIAGVTAFQLRPARRSAAPAALITPEGTASTAQPASDPIPSPSDQATAPVRISIPASGWGRNPFLTTEEIASLNAPEEIPVPIEVSAPAEPSALPQHELTGIVANQDVSVAVINSRVVRVGDRIGVETVKEIKSRSVVLESQGSTREISLKPIGLNGLEEAVPRGELQ
jgi:hypothetical protein